MLIFVIDFSWSDVRGEIPYSLKSPAWVPSQTSFCQIKCIRALLKISYHIDIGVYNSCSHVELGSNLVIIISTTRRIGKIKIQSNKIRFRSLRSYWKIRHARFDFLVDREVECDAAATARRARDDEWFCSNYDCSS